jgi:hypothetical protein
MEYAASDLGCWRWLGIVVSLIMPQNLARFVYQKKEKKN